MNSHTMQRVEIILQSLNLSSSDAGIINTISSINEMIKQGDMNQTTISIEAVDKTMRNNSLEQTKILARLESKSKLHFACNKQYLHMSIKKSASNNNVEADIKWI